MIHRVEAKVHVWSGQTWTHINLFELNLWSSFKMNLQLLVKHQEALKYLLLCTEDESKNLTERFDLILLFLCEPDCGLSETFCSGHEDAFEASSLWAEGPEVMGPQLKHQGYETA